MAITISGENNNDRILAQDGVIDEISGINIVGLLTAGHINVGSNIQLGNAGIVTATTFIGNLTGNVNSTSPLLLQTGGSERFRITGNNELGIAGANYGSSGQVLTSGGSGSAVTWSAIPTQVTIANNADNRVITGGSGINLNGEANFIAHAPSSGVGYVELKHGGSSGDYGYYQIRSGSTLRGRLGSNYNVDAISLDTAGGSSTAMIFKTGSSQTERLRIDSSGRLIVGGGTDPAESTIVAKGNSTSATSYSVLDMRRGQAATSDGDVLGYIRFSDTNIPSSNNNYGLIFGACDGASSGAGDNPGRLVFSTTADGASGPTERLRITSGGQVNIGTSELTQTTRLLNVYGGQTRTTMTSAGNAFEVFSHTGSGQSYGILCQGGTTANDYAATFRNTSGNTLFRIRGDGNIGINESSPGTKLHIKGSGEILRLETTASGGGQCYIDFDDETATRASIGLRGSSSDTLTIAALNSGLRFDVQNANSALLINSNGCLQHTTASGVSYFTGSSEYIIGSTTSSPPAGGYESPVQIHTSKTRSAFTLAAYNNNAGGPFMTFISSRSTTRGTLGSAIGSADTLGDIRFTGDNGTNYNSVALGARIMAKAASAPGSGDSVIAGRIMFSTGTATGGSDQTQMEIREDGELMLRRGRINNNGSVLYCWGGFVAGNATLSFDVPVLTQGNIYRIDMFHSHHSMAYGAYKYGIYGAYSGHSGLQINNDIASQNSSNNGTWSVSRGSAGQPIVIAKSAGTYGGQGSYFVNVYAGNYAAL